MNQIARFFWWLSTHPRITIIISLAVPFVVLGLAIAGRTVPIEFLGPANVPEAKAGQEITFSVPIDRHIERGCHLTVQRYIISSDGAQRAVGGEEDITSEGRKIRDSINPGMLIQTIRIPPTLKAGKSKVLNEAWFRCPQNLTTIIVPISASYAWDFIVLPPDETH